MELFRSQVSNYFLCLFVIDKKICKNVRIVLMFHNTLVSWLIRSDKIIEQVAFFEKNPFLGTVLKPYFLWIIKMLLSGRFQILNGARLSDGLSDGRSTESTTILTTHSSLGADIFIIQSFSDKSISSNENFYYTIQTKHFLCFSTN